MLDRLDRLTGPPSAGPNSSGLQPKRQFRRGMDGALGFGSFQMDQSPNAIETALLNLPGQEHSATSLAFMIVMPNYPFSAIGAATSAGLLDTFL